MRGITGGIAALGAAAVLAAPAGATPSGTSSPGNYPSEVADSPTIENTYPTVVVVLKAVNPAAFQNGVLGARKTVPRRPLAVTAQRGTLPFTGVPLFLLALVGGSLLGSGLLLLRTART